MRSFLASADAVTSVWHLLYLFICHNHALLSLHWHLSFCLSVCVECGLPHRHICLSQIIFLLSNQVCCDQQLRPHTPSAVPCGRFLLPSSHMRHKLGDSTLLVTGFCTSRHFRQVLQQRHLRKVNELSANRSAMEESYELSEKQSCGMKTIHNSGTLFLDWSS